jgi:CheY-like chemotaxis protein/HPt (histidine-containing phosphotransfer) domain-containing protein
VRVAQIMINFANNAVKFTQSGEVVLRVSTLSRKERCVRLRFEVSDTGIGIPEEKLPLLFRPFQQLEGGIDRRFEGTGLGLAISKSLAELMGGQVGVESREGHGSVFYLELNLQVAAGEDLAPTELLEAPAEASRDTGVGEPARSELPDAPQSLRNRHVLVVEDNPINREVVHDLLELVGVRVTAAADGMEALRLLNDQCFDAVLMDVHLPVMDGFEVTAAARRSARFPATPIIALTANALAGDRERCLRAGMDDYIPKPVDPKQLYATLARHCGASATSVHAKTAPQGAAREASDRGQVLSALEAIPGLDTVRGLQHVMGRIDLYTSLAHRIAHERADVPRQVESALRKGDQRKLAGLLHDAKSMLGTLGAFRLQETCADLEKKVSGGQPLDSAIAEFCTDYSKLMALVSRATSGADANEPL